MSCNMPRCRAVQQQSSDASAVPTCRLAPLRSASAISAPARQPHTRTCQSPISLKGRQVGRRGQQARQHENKQRLQAWQVNRSSNNIACCAMHSRTQSGRTRQRLAAEVGARQLAEPQVKHLWLCTWEGSVSRLVGDTHSER